jgi:NhaP-type Na+/H+ or K+/H+ antiporter
MDTRTAATLGDIVGAVIGGILWGYLIGMLIGASLKRLEPDERAAVSVTAAWLVMALIAGFGYANGGSFRLGAGLQYIPGAIIAFLLLRRRYWKLWSDDEEVTPSAQ